MREHGAMPGLRLLALLASMSLVAASCSTAPPPNIVLIVVDTLRADRLGSFGNQRGLTPFLDELAKQGTVFLNTYSTTSYTVPAVASLFTSRYVSQHRVINADSTLGDAENTLAEELARAGYMTAGFSGNIMISAEHGYGQGFQHFWGMRLLKMRAYTIRQRVRMWLDARSGRDAPLFLYLHYFEPHAPYAPPDAYRSQFGLPGVSKADEETARRKEATWQWKTLRPDETALLASLYDAEVAGFDAQLRLQFDELRQRGVLDHAIVVITADHGEEFQEHGEMGHGLALYNELVHIPLIVVAPGYAPRRVSQTVSLVDIAPTVLKLIGQPSQPTFEGRSLTPLMRGSGVVGWLRTFAISLRAPAPPPILFELERQNGPYDLRRHSAGLIAGSTKLLQGPQGEQVYDLNVDPSETGVRPFDDRAMAEKLRTLLATVRAQLQRRAVTNVESRPLDQGTKEKLRALGYQVE